MTSHRALTINLEHAYSWRGFSLKSVGSHRRCHCIFLTTVESIRLRNFAMSTARLATEASFDDVEMTMKMEFEIE